MVVEKANNVTSGVVVLTTTLPEDIANGRAGLVINFNFGAWSQAEVTEIHALGVVRELFSSVVDNQATIAASGTSINTQHYAESSYWGGGISLDFETGAYTKFNLAQFAAADSAYTATLTMPTFNFSAYNETYFGFTAVTAAGEATVNVHGASYSFDLNDGYVYVKMIVRGNMLTIVGDGEKNVGQVLASVELSESILNGTESLVISYSTAGWSQVELSELQTVSWVSPIQ